ncbi:hypothetical protein GC163_10635 [bacterium]|nr:hypothetical protein [bacterium]
MTALRAGLVMGSRPELLKLAPLSQACQRRSDVHVDLIMTAELASGAIDFDLPSPLAILPAETVAAPIETLTELLSQFDRIWSSRPWDCVVLHGASLTTFAAGLAASASRIPIVQIDPQGTSATRNDAHWEQFQRRSAGWLAQMHCVPTRQSAQRLQAAGHPRHMVYVTGDSSVDAWSILASKALSQIDSSCDRFAWLHNRPFVVLDAHTPHRLDASEFAAINTLADRHPDLQFVLLGASDTECHNGTSPDALNLQRWTGTSLVEEAWLKTHCGLIISATEVDAAQPQVFHAPVIRWDFSLTAPISEHLARISRNAPLATHSSGARIGERSSPSGRAAERIVDLLSARAWNEPMTVRRAA